MYSKELPATDLYSTDIPISLSDIYFLILYTVAGLCVAIVLLLSEICVRGLFVKNIIYTVSRDI